MFKRMSALIISISLLSTQFVAVYAENNDKTQLPPNNEQIVEYCTDRFIVETKTDTDVSAFSTNETDISDEEIAIAINEVLSDEKTISDEINVSDVNLIEENSSVVTLSESVNADEFMQAVEETLGDAVTVQPDYPIYMDMAPTINSKAISDIETTAVTATPRPKSDWEQSIFDAKKFIHRRRSTHCRIGRIL